MDLADLLPRSDEDRFLFSPPAERLDKLKPTIIQLYMGNYGPGGKKMTIQQVTQYMKDKYFFHMSPNQLAYTLREKWNVRRRILKQEKEDVIVALGKRSRAGASTSDVALQEGKPVDKKQLKRHLQDKIRRHVIEPMEPGVLSSWNLPYAALIKSIVRQPDMPSPFGNQIATPDNITVNSPKNTAGASPSATTSPSMQLIRQGFVRDQSNLLLQGRLQELFIKCGREDRIALTSYMHDFWIHTFVTAKYWGRGPLLWTKEMIATMTLNSLASIRSVAASPANSIESSPLPPHDEPISLPPQHCRWVIHVSEEQLHPGEQYDEAITNPSHTMQTPWSLAEYSRRSFSQSVQETITESAFTSLTPDELPISGSLIAESLRNDPSSLQLESLRFAIIAGNVDLVESVIVSLRQAPDGFDGLTKIYPYHLAANYLDGGNTCCYMFATLIDHLSGKYPVHLNYEDDMGHTILDSLIISTIRSHTRIIPRDVSASFINTNAYPGEEKDACGRWDADSPAIRQLFQRGRHRVPLSWKHPFCHSSVQAVCHSIALVFSPGYHPHIDRASGLFVRHCTTCGAKLTLETLHLLVILAYHLAESGIPGETLFGTVAMLVCLLRLGVDVSQKAKVSIHEILGVSSVDTCHHEEVDANDFMQTIPSVTINHWSPGCQEGWHCMRGILRLAKLGKIHRRNTDIGDPKFSQHSGSSGQFDLMDFDNGINLPYQDAFDDHNHPNNSDNDDDDDDNDDDDSTSSEHEAVCDRFADLHILTDFPCGNPQLGLVWAVVQAEMLTYRKIEGSDPWISPNFSMTALKKWLEGESEELDMPFVQNHLLKEHTICGWFEDALLPICTANEATKQHIMNMDMNEDANENLYYRASFHPVPDI